MRPPRYRCPMLTEVADGVLVHESTFCQTNSVVVRGPNGVLLIDPGIHEAELECLASDLSDAGHAVIAVFSTHPHWDHLLWHARLGNPPRWATALCAETAHERLSHGIDSRRFGIPEDVPLELLGRIEGLGAGTQHIPWDGPSVRILEHRAHAPGHAALVVEDRGVLIAGDMLSDVLVPMFDLRADTDPIEDYLAGLHLLEGAADGVEVVIPGHGSVGAQQQLRTRIGDDRAYALAVRSGGDVDDPRVGPTAKEGWDWVSDVHSRQLEGLAARNA